MTSIAYLGPRGTFAEAALRAMPVSAAAELTSYPTVAAALDAVRSGTSTYALVPIENSVEGAVTGTLDELALGDPLVILDEQVIAIRFALLVRPGTALADVRRVATHPVAAAQCRAWLAANLADAEVVPESSNAVAAQAVGEGTAYDAAIASAAAAEAYGLEVLVDGIGDNEEAWVTWAEAVATNRAVLARERDHLPWVDRELQVLEFLARERGVR